MTPATPKCPRCGRRGEPAGDFFRCPKCGGFFDDDPNEGGTHHDRPDVSAERREAVERRKKGAKK